MSDESDNKPASGGDANGNGNGAGQQKDPVAAAAAAAAAAGVQLTPEMIRQLMPRPRDLLRAQRRLTWAMAGCFTLIILAILATLFIPWWEFKQQARDLVKEHLLLIRDGHMDAAHAQSGLWRDDFDAMIERLRLRQLLAGEATIEIHNFETIENEAFVVGVLRPANNAPPRGFRVRVYNDGESMKVERIILVE